MSQIAGFTAKGTTLNIGHRGATSLAPENTLQAAQKAFEAGADMWELDVRMTADGELVLLHDRSLPRTSNAKQIFPRRRPWRLESFTLAELRQLEFGAWYNQKDPFEQIAAGNVSVNDQARYAHTPIPTLREALAFTRDHNWQVNLEIEHTPGHAPSIVADVAALIESMGMVEQVLISSFHHRYLSTIKEINPRIATGALDSKPRQRIPSLLKRLDAQVYLPRSAFATPEMTASLAAQGYAIIVWTANELADMQKLLAMGVSGIITDFPQRLSSILS